MEGQGSLRRAVPREPLASAPGTSLPMNSHSLPERALPLANLLLRCGRLLAAWDRQETALSCPSPSQEWSPGPAECGLTRGPLNPSNRHGCRRVTNLVTLCLLRKTSEPLKLGSSPITDAEEKFKSLAWQAPCQGLSPPNLQCGRMTGTVSKN